MRASCCAERAQLAPARLATTLTRLIDRPLQCGEHTFVSYQHRAAESVPRLCRNAALSSTVAERSRAGPIVLGAYPPGPSPYWNSVARRGVVRACGAARAQFCLRPRLLDAPGRRRRRSAARPAKAPGASSPPRAAMPSARAERRSAACDPRVVSVPPRTCRRCALPARRLGLLEQVGLSIQAEPSGRISVPKAWRKRVAIEWASAVQSASSASRLLAASHLLERVRGRLQPERARPVCRS